MEKPALSSETEALAALFLDAKVTERQSVSTSVVVPVSWAKNPSEEKLVYALLDTQSDTASVEQDVSNDLQVASYPVKPKPP